MAEFKFKERKNILVLKICGKEYSFDVSPTNYSFVKKVAGLWHEVEAVVNRFADTKNKPFKDIEKSFDYIKEKEQEIVEFLLPGAWDELFALANTDLMNMVDLIGFIASEIKAAGVQAKIDSVEPTSKGTDEV